MFYVLRCKETSRIYREYEVCRWCSKQHISYVTISQLKKTSSFNGSEYTPAFRVSDVLYNIYKHKSAVK